MRGLTTHFAQVPVEIVKKRVTDILRTQAPGNGTRETEPTGKTKPKSDLRKKTCRRGKGI